LFVLRAHFLSDAFFTFQTTVFAKSRSPWEYRRRIILAFMDQYLVGEMGSRM
jgi:hypothetical protein